MVRYGILGFGLHAVRRLMPGFSLARNSTVTALCRRNVNDARASAAQYNIAHAFDSAADLCRSSEVDAIFVASPNSSHLEHVLLALEARKPVLCEKPMAMNAEECSRMVTAARAADVPLGVAQVFRFNRTVEKLRERIGAGQIGKPAFVRSEFAFMVRNHPRKWMTNSKVAGGGPMVDIGVHCIDSVRYILDDEIVRVHANAISDQDSGDVESAAILSLEFSRGPLGVVWVSTRAEYRTPLEITGEAGTLKGVDALSVDQPGPIELRQPGNMLESEVVSNRDAYARQVDAFSATVEGKSTFPIPGDEGWQNQEVLDAAYRSLRTGKVEAVPVVSRVA
jgi:predicted dehydrogenase